MVFVVLLILDGQHMENSDINAHPHLDRKKKIALVHNGIIENYGAVKEGYLKKGVFLLLVRQIQKFLYNLFQSCTTIVKKN